MKKWILSVSLAAGVLALSACNNADENEVVVKSKAGDVTQEELFDALKTKFTPQVEQALQDLVLTQVLSDNYEVSDKELDKKLEEAKEQLGENFETTLSQYNLTEESFKEYLKLQLLQEKAALKDIEVTDEDLKAFYETWSPEAEIRHILVDDLAKAEEIKKQLAEGKSFEDLAKENSNDTGSAQNGGSLGWIDYQGRQGFVPEFSAALDKLEIGEVSEPIQSQYGYHIIEITDMKEKAPFEDMKEELKDMYMTTLVTPETIQAAMKEELEEADLDIKDEQLENTFKAILDAGALPEIPAEDVPEEE
ncbi:peptidylprolyl isomerase [Bacillus sp. 2205SS5-2]|uniref:peptidylprolyl isomerase n=1 Tax=Bacillus sp. 2205SS5-2 TaxID=3109031 RepID=UPI0030061DB9